jgi:hypothetical protein
MVALLVALAGLARWATARRKVGAT